MKYTILAARTQRALTRLLAACEQLAQEAGIEPPALDIPKGDTAHQQMFLLEQLADFTESLTAVDTAVDTAVEDGTAVAPPTPPKKKLAKKGS